MRSITFILWGFIGSGPIIWNLYYFGFQYGNNLYLMDLFDWIMTLAPLFLGGLYFYIYFISAKKSFQKNKFFRNLKYEYTFGIDDFLVSSTSDNSTGSSTIKVFFLKRIYETSNYFYLFNDNRNAFIVKKSALSKEDTLALRIRLQTILGKKYLICK